MIGGLDATGCRLLHSADRVRWKALSERTNPFVGPDWERAIGSLGHRSQILVTGDPEVTGVLPLTFRRSRIFGKSLVSVPAAGQGGIAADDDDSRDRLLRGARHLADHLDVAYLELREGIEEPGFHLVSDHYVTVRVSLAGGAEQVLSRVRKRSRKYARAGVRDGLTIEVDRDLNAFYPVYCETMRRRGSPPFSRRFFAAILDAFGAKAEIATVRSGGQVAAADLLIRDAHTQYSLYAGSHAPLHHLRPNDVLVHAELRRACDLGLRTFDLGRSTIDSSALNFKAGWGGETAPLTYSYYLRRGDLPSRDPNAFPWAHLGRAWSRLPEAITTRLGPHIVRNLH